MDNSEIMVQFPAGVRNLSPKPSDRFWGTPSLLLSRCLRLFMEGKASRSVKLSTILHLLLRLITHAAIPLVPKHLHAMVLNYTQGKLKHFLPHRYFIQDLYSYVCPRYISIQNFMCLTEVLY